MLTKKQKQLLDKISEIDNIDGDLRLLLDRTSKNINEIKKTELVIRKIVEEKTMGFPWLADAIAQYYEHRDLKISEFLKHKLRPAISSAERVREIAREKRVLQKQFRITRKPWKTLPSTRP